MLSSDSAMTYPEPGSASLEYAQHSQIIANTSGCPIGIYKKVPNDLDLQPDPFCPRTPEITGGAHSDVLGAWMCISTVSKTYNAFTTPGEVLSDGVAAGFLDDPAYVRDWEDSLDSDGTELDDNEPNAFNQITVWSYAYANSTENEPWTVKFGVEVNGSFSQEPFGFQYYQCTLKSSPADKTGILDTILSSINDTAMLTEWTPALLAYLYFGKDSPARPDADVRTAMLLNSITMISGADDYLLAQVSDDEDPFYGCARKGSSVSIYVIAYMAFSIALCMLFIAWYCLLKIQLILLTRERRYIQFVPTDVSTWTAFAAYFSAGARHAGVGKTSSEIGGGDEMNETKWTREHLRGQRVRLENDCLVIYRDDEALTPEDMQNVHHQDTTYTTYTVPPNKVS